MSDLFRWLGGQPTTWWVAVLAATAILVNVVLFIVKERPERRRRSLEQASLKASARLSRVRRLDLRNFIGAQAIEFIDYLPIELDAAIADTLSSGRDPLILLGRPGLGKTHAALHHIQGAFPRWQMLAPTPQALREIAKVRVPRKDTVLFLDDLEKYVDAVDSEGEDIRDQIDLVRSRVRKLVVVATLRSTAPESRRVASADSKLLGRSTIIRLNDWTDQQGRTLAQRSGQSMDRWDGTPLSVKQPSLEMQLRYDTAQYGVKMLLQALAFLRRHGLKPADRSIVGQFLDAVGAEEAKKHVGELLEVAASLGFLRQAAGVDAYDAYLDALPEWHWGPDEAVKLQHLLEQPDRVLDLMRFGASYYQREEFLIAESVYRRCIELAPSNESCHYRLGIVLSRMRRWKDAAESFAHATELRPRWATAWRRLSRAREELGDADGATEATHQAHLLEVPPAVARSLQARALADKGDYDTAVAEYRSAIAEDPFLFEAHIALGWLLQQQGDIGAAVAAFSRATEAEPASGLAHSYLAGALGDAGEIDRAIETARQAVALSPSLVAAHFCLARLLKRTGDFSGAVTALTRTLELEPSSAVAHSHLASALADNGETDRAIDAARRAIALDPSLFRAHLGLGISLKRKGDLDGATAAFAHAVELEPSSAIAHSYLASALADSGEIGGSIEAARKAVALNPSLREAHVGLGRSLMRKKDYAGAATVFARTVELDPGSALAHSYLAQAHLQAGNALAAASEARKAVVLQPDLVRAHYGLAKALERMGDPEAALQTFRHVLDLRPGYQPAEGAIKRLEKELGQTRRSTTKGNPPRDPS